MDTHNWHRLTKVHSAYSSETIIMSVHSFTQNMRGNEVSGTIFN